LQNKAFRALDLCHCGKTMACRFRQWFCVPMVLTYFTDLTLV
jgi:hypothetical protein